MTDKRDVWFFECDCGCEILRIENDLGDLMPLKEVSLSIFRHGNRCEMLSEKLRYIWQIIRYGRPYADDMILDYETTKKLGKTLIEITTEVSK